MTKWLKKCCVTACKSNYASETEKVTVYRLPSDHEEQQRWIKAIPRDNIPDTVNTVVCAKHFPSDSPVIKGKGGKMRPKEPPSIFHNIPKSLLPTSAPPKQPTTKAISSSRRFKEDDLQKFLMVDKITSFQILCSELY